MFLKVENVIEISCGCSIHKSNNLGRKNLKWINTQYT